ncbi:MAG TPA: nicotinate (nicotinamide) nucleotide adenylyltransferase [Terracidiphilus sp.]
MVQESSAGEREPTSRAVRVAFFGGSFDPPHNGHLAVARAAREALGLDRVLFAPVGAQPLKPQGSTADFHHRLAMTELAIAGEPAFGVSLLDAPNPAGTPNYTLHTLQKLKADMPGVNLFCLMGADSFVSLRRWYGAAEIPFEATLVIASRPGEDIQDLAAHVPAGLALEIPQFCLQSANPDIALVTCALRNPQGRTASLYILPGLNVEVSATEVRAQIRSGNIADAAHPLIPGAVAGYVREHGLYL